MSQIEEQDQWIGAPGGSGHSLLEASLADGAGEGRGAHEIPDVPQSSAIVHRLGAELPGLPSAICVEVGVAENRKSQRLAAFRIARVDQILGRKNRR